MKRVEEIYVGVFELPGNEPTETILCGMRKLKDGSMQIRGSFEHELNAVPGLVSFCDFISEKLKLKWRLLKLEHPQEIDKKIVDEYRQLCNCAGLH